MVLGPAWATAVLLSLGIGVSLGLLGGGGSILTVPILVYILELEPHVAIATSLVVVGATAAAALLPHARAGRVRWRTGASFGAASMVGAYAAGRVAHRIEPTVLLVVLAIVMLGASRAMMRGGRGAREAVAVNGRPLGMVLLPGLGLGALSGLVGAGGGFLVVPTLVLIAGMPMGHAVGTSLLVIAMNSAAALAGHLPSVNLEAGVAAWLTAAAVVGSVWGGSLVGRLSAGSLRAAFAWFTGLMGVFILARELPAAAGLNPSMAKPWHGIVGVLTLLGLVFASGILRRRAQADVTAAVAPRSCNTVSADVATPGPGMQAPERSSHDPFQAGPLTRRS